MGNSPCANMFDDYFHLRIIRKASILLFKTKVGRMEVDNKGGRIFCVFLQDIGRRFHLIIVISSAVNRNPFHNRRLTIWLRALAYPAVIVCRHCLR